MSMFVIPSISIAHILQALGYTGTCTQGANGPFITGTVLSSPLLLVSVFLLVRAFRRTVRHPLRDGYVLDGIASLGTVPLAIWMACSNGSVAHDTLWLGVGPCGPDYTPDELFRWPDMAVGLAYVVLPMLIAVLAGTLLWSSLPIRFRIGLK